MPFLGIYFLRFNCSKAPFDDLQVRRRFRLRSTRRGSSGRSRWAGEIADGVRSAGVAEAMCRPRRWLDNPEEARRLLAEGGRFPDGAKFPLGAFAEREGLERGDRRGTPGRMLAEGTRRGGDLARQEWKVYLNSMNDLDVRHPRDRAGWGTTRTSNAFLDMFVTNGGNNRTGYSSAGVRQADRRCVARSRTQRSALILQAAEKLLIETDSAAVSRLYFYVRASSSTTRRRSAGSGRCARRASAQRRFIGSDFVTQRREVSRSPSF